MAVRQGAGGGVDTTKLGGNCMKKRMLALALVVLVATGAWAATGYAAYAAQPGDTPQTETTQPPTDAAPFFDMEKVPLRGLWCWK